MRKKLVRAASLLLAAVLTVGPAASASQALGTEIHIGKTHLAQGVDYTRQYLWSATYSDLRTERYLEYTPNTLVQPAVAYGGTVLEKKTLTALAQGLEAEGKRVLGGVNGDYFELATGAPLGLVVTDGVLRSSSSYLYALGFDAGGRAFIGMPSLSVTADFGGTSHAVSGGVNKIRTVSGGYVLYTDDFAATTEHTEPGVDVILAPVMGASAELTIGGRLSCTVEQVLQSTGSIDIPEGRLVLSVNSKAAEALVSALTALQPGDTVEISVAAADSRWESAVTAIGGLYKMVTNGVVEPGLDTTETAQAPRTAVGIRADGSAVFYTVDGRQSGYSVGASMKQVAERLVELGCVEAMCLDGGGSTTFGASLPGDNSFGVLNRPSDGSQRAVTNALFLTALQAPVGMAGSLVLTPGDALVLAGAQVELSAAGVDAIGQTVRTYSGNELSWSVSGSGTVENGVFTAGTQAGAAAVSAQTGGLTGGGVFTVVTTPDKITVKNEDTGAALTSVSVEPGGTVRLTAGAVYRNLELVCSDEDFTWSVTGGLGTIDENGTFIAGETGGAGSITVSAGGRTATLPLTVASHICTVENFEGGFQNMADSMTAQIRPEQRSAYVRYGSQSARISYDLSGSEFAAVSVHLDFQEGERYLSLWVYGDGSGNTLTAPVRLADGSSSEQSLTALNFTGWRQIIVPLPDGADQILALKITPTGSAATGTIWLDQVTTSNQYLTDSKPPVVTVSLSGNKVTATLQDDVDQSFDTAQIAVTYDGQALAFTQSGATVTADLPAQDGAAHRVTVAATDASGNIGRASADIAAADGRTAPFADTENHWASVYISYLYDQNISNGISVGDTLCFQPDKNITRGEFALMVARWLRLDLTAYSSVKLPFTDTDSIPSWCLDAVKAMYSLGIMEGSENRISAGNDITRAEAMTMLGRIQQKGYAGSELTFADAASIPAWAADHMKVLVTQGVIGGYEDNTILPNACIKRGEMAKILYAMR